jgi:hypothetical protein
MVHVNTCEKDVVIITGKIRHLEKTLQESYYRTQEGGLIINPPSPKNEKIDENK